MSWYQVTCARASCTIAWSGDAAAKARMYLRLRGDSSSGGSAAPTFAPMTKATSMLPRLSFRQFQLLASAVVGGGLLLTAIWVARGRGPYPVFLAMELGEGPDTHGLAAGGLTFIVVMIPCLAVIFGLRALSPLPPLRQKLSREGLAAARAEYRAVMDGTGAHRETARVARALGIAAAGGVVGAGIRCGWFEAWFGDPGSLEAARATAVAFGLAAGLLHGRRALERLGYAVALCGVSAGVLPAATWYLGLRPDALQIELTLPILVGGLPGGLLFAVVRWLAGRASSRGSP